VITLAHGGGGLLGQRLLESVFLPGFGQNPGAQARHDGAIFTGAAGQWAFTSDAHVVAPLFFPGGDIGRLAVFGTANDLLMCGARPLFLSLCFILEEGFPIADLRRVAESIGAAAREAGAEVVTGDTKVVEKNRGDGLYLAASGIGRIVKPCLPAKICPGDAILLSGDIGRHGVAVMGHREGLAFETEIKSDCACLAPPVLALLESGIDVHCLRDLTRGGLAAALIELAAASGYAMAFDETRIPVEEQVRGACELLGLDPLFVANEGRFVTFVPAVQTSAALEILHAFDLSQKAVCIGSVGDQSGTPHVAVSGLSGVPRILQLPAGEQLPRIC